MCDQKTLFLVLSPRSPSPGSYLDRDPVSGKPSGEDGERSGGDGEWSGGDGERSGGDGERSGVDGERSGVDREWRGGDGEWREGDGEWRGQLERKDETPVFLRVTDVLGDGGLCAVCLCTSPPLRGTCRNCSLPPTVKTPHERYRGMVRTP